MPTNAARPLTDDADGAPSARRGRPVGDHEAKRRELLKAASAVLAEEGYANLSLRKVAQRAGCTTGALTYYFANKEQLVTALAEAGFDRFDAMLEAGREEADVRAILGQWVTRAMADPDLWPVMFETLAHARHEPAFAGVIERRYAHFREVYAEILAAGQVRGTVRSDIAADLLADQLSAMGDGWMMMLPAEPERFTPSRIRALTDAVVTLIAPPPRPPRKKAS